jgi:hypothetical protein
MSSVLKNLGQLHIVTGAVAADGESMTSNDGSASIATNGPGDFTVTFGQPFLSAPVVSASVVDAAVAATEAVGVSVVALTSSMLPRIFLSNLLPLVCEITDGSNLNRAVG